MVLAIIVTYNPDLDLIEKQYNSIKSQVAEIIYIDNASSNIDLLVNKLEHHAIFIQNEINEGLGKAQNQGILLAKIRGATHVLLLDQDSVASPNLVSTLLDVEESYQNRGIKVGLVGPQILDVLSSPPQYSDGFVFSGTRIKRIKIEEEVTPVSYCIASGSLISIHVLDDVGLINEELFIDGLDVEWCLRAKSINYEVLMSGVALLEHQLGNGHKKKILSHSSTREYYISRNNILMLKYSYIPLGYRIRKILGIFYRLFKSLQSCSLDHFRQNFNGIIDGVNGKSGSILND